MREFVIVAVIEGSVSRQDVHGSPLGFWVRLAHRVPSAARTRRVAIMACVNLMSSDHMARAPGFGSHSSSTQRSEPPKIQFQLEIGLEPSPTLP